MKEKYLHYLWKYKMLPFHRLRLKDHSEFKVYYPGDYNAYESGPDFLNATIEINGVKWVGNVELHVKSMDWFQHGHQFDSAYNNVILHVVYEFNGEVIQNNNLLPTLELKGVIEQDHFLKFDKFFKNKKTILCSSQLKNVLPFYFTSLKEKAILQRLHRKTFNLEEISGSSNPKQILYFLLARAMGAKINQLPFEELTYRLPINSLKKLNNVSQSRLIQQTSGISIIETPEDCVSWSNLIKFSSRINGGVVNRSSWKFGGTRPGNSPNIRINQFALLVEKFDFEISFLYLSVPELKNYLLELLTITEGSKLSKGKTKELTQTFKEQLIINCFVPFLYWFGQLLKDDILVDKAIDLLRTLRPEQNSILQKWKECGVVCHNAAESQAFLEIFNELCTRKKCLSCDIGKQLLNK